jgi:signal transduction histidine kinase
VSTYADAVTPTPTWRRRRVAWGVFLVAAVFVVVGSALLVSDLVRGTVSVSDAVGQFALLPPAGAFSVVGLVVALRRPANACGWLMLVIGAIWSLGVGPPTREDSILAWATAWAWLPAFGLMATHLPLRLPDGRLLSPRWRWVSRAATVGMLLLSIGLVFDPTLAGNPVPALDLRFVGAVGLLTLALSTVASIASLFVRSRRAGADERHQLRWIASGAVVFFGGWGATLVIGWGSEPGPSMAVVAFAAYAAIPVSIGVAILRYRLYDIDVVIRKAVLVGVIAAFFLAVYALVVGGVGALTQSVGNTALSFAAAAIVAVLFQPVLARARRFADRVVYGKRATPYEVLARFGDRLAETYASEDVLTRTARVLAEGIGADATRVWLGAGPQQREVASFVREGIAPGTPEDFRTDVRHQGETLGALSVAMPSNDPMDPSKEKLVVDLAAQAGLLLRNVALLDDLRASRRRLVAAQDEERRRLERNIHDGAQQQLVALAVKARLARQLTDRDPARASDMLTQIEGETQQALDDLRDLARGIYPPLLADKGLVAALEAQARKAAIPIAVHGEGVGRFDQDVEAAVYFSCLEALQNVAKYAQASRADLQLTEGEGGLTFSVTDDGVGFDPEAIGYGSGLQGIADRLGAIDGSVEVRSRPGGGTTVRGAVPLVPMRVGVEP